jgi:hypothetical protein
VRQHDKLGIGFGVRFATLSLAGFRVFPLLRPAQLRDKRGLFELSVASGVDLPPGPALKNSMSVLSSKG